MPVHFQRLAAMRATAILLIAVLCWTLPSNGFAVTNAKIRAAQEQATQAESQLEELQADLEERSEEYFAIEAKVEETSLRITETERDLEIAQSDLSQAKLKLNGRAGAMYRTGSMDMIAVLLGATDFRDLVTCLDLMQRIGRSDAAIVAAVKDAKTRTEAAMDQLERRRAEELVLRDQAQTKKLEVEAAVGAQEQYLAKLDTQIKKLIAEEKKRQERLAAERLAAAAKGVGRAGRPFDADALAAATPHPEAVTWARKYVGITPYVWGGTTPSGFDCSGLVQYCYRQIGIEIPRTSRTQYRVGAFIPPTRLDLLMPGDLVFFGRGGDPGRIHHVAMYIGDGKMIHAPQTGRRVSIDSLTARISSRGDYVGGIRP